MQNNSTRDNAELLFKGLYNLGDLNAAIAHDLNNPLAVIIGQAELILMLQEAGNVGPEELKTKLGKIIGASKKMSEVIAQMGKLPKNTPDKKEASILISDIYNLLELNLAYHSKMYEVPVDFSHDGCIGLHIDGIWGEIYSSIHLILADILNAQRDIDEEKYLKVRFSKEENFLQVNISFPPIKKFTQISLDVLRDTTNEHKGFFSFSGSKIQTTFPISQK